VVHSAKSYSWIFVNRYIVRFQVLNSFVLNLDIAKIIKIKDFGAQFGAKYLILNHNQQLMSLNLLINNSKKWK